MVPTAVNGYLYIWIYWLGEYFRIHRLLIKHWSQITWYQTKKTTKDNWYKDKTFTFHFKSWFLLVTLNLKRADLYMKMITPSNLQLMWWSHHQKKFSSEVTSCHEAANYQLAVQRGWFLLITIHQIKKELLKAIEYFLSVWYSFFQAIWCRRRGFHSSGYI